MYLTGPIIFQKDQLELVSMKIQRYISLNTELHDILELNVFRLDASQ